MFPSLTIVRMLTIQVIEARCGSKLYRNQKLYFFFPYFYLPKMKEGAFHKKGINFNFILLKGHRQKPHQTLKSQSYHRKIFGHRNTEQINNPSLLLEKNFKHTGF